MIDFAGFVQTEGQPIYLQIMRYIKQGLAAGTIADGEELPSRRALSAFLTVNPNTVQKAYRLLEEEGLVQSVCQALLCGILHRFYKSGTADLTFVWYCYIGHKMNVTVMRRA